jgi:glyoxylate reductase
MSPRILVTRRPPGRVIPMLEEAGEVALWERDEVMPRDRLLAAVALADALYCMLTDTVDAELLDAAPRLRAVSAMAVGVDNIDLDECTRRGIPVGHTPGVLADTVADLAIGLTLMASRRLVEGVEYVRAGSWQTWEPELLFGGDVHGTTVGIVGMGGVGTAIARRLAGFDCRILVWNRTPRPALMQEVDAEQVDLDQLLRSSAHVIVAVALTAETRHLIDARALRLMRSDAVLVNVSRGGTVDQVALQEALASGAIRAAALDVTDPEPIDVDDPLLAMPNCIVIPHLGSSTERTRAAMAEMAGRNLIAGLRGEPMEACANAAPGTQAR